MGMGADPGSLSQFQQTATIAPEVDIIRDIGILCALARARTLSAAFSFSG
jgi:hypothetical protein